MCSNLSNQNIIGMDDDEEGSDPEDQIGGGGGVSALFGSVGIGAGDEGSNPFNKLTDLFCHNAHLTVFVNYVIYNSDPSSLVREII
jgi:hypothetical protein